MIATRNKPSRLRLRAIAKPQAARWSALWPLLLLAGYLLFAHGCHGDEDNELFMSLTSPAAADGR